ncbi:hypothetical protein [Cupriavidus neocaledonicus]|uniref:Uncharacterized protein n=1 Tax=Cupriavidus neocaledonicus TaxID=1040979 RepID=A0A375H6Z3_9BURK|nr:hypothetical protein [Cupriavidus neocaledonicus]SPD47482.1 conserved protein of unknown function [Cupriavidus neocaledonicus]
MSTELRETSAVFLEAQFFPDDQVEERLDCEGISERRDRIVVHGLDVRHIRALRWTPDYVSFQAAGQVRRHAVSRWAEAGPNTVVFARRERAPTPDQADHGK